MYLSAIVGRIAESMTARRRHRLNTGHSGRGLPSGLDGLSDYQLRDIGYVRERTISPRNHVLWM